MADGKKSDIKSGTEQNGGLTQSERVILEKSMIRHDKALKILSKLAVLDCHRIFRHAGDARDPGWGVRGAADRIFIGMVMRCIAGLFIKPVVITHREIIPESFPAILS
jgi:hypothetical protein